MLPKSRLSQSGVHRKVSFSIVQGLAKSWSTTLSDCKYGCSNCATEALGLLLCSVRLRSGQDTQLQILGMAAEALQRSVRLKVFAGLRSVGGTARRMTCRGRDTGEVIIQCRCSYGLSKQGASFHQQSLTMAVVRQLEQGLVAWTTCGVLVRMLFSLHSVQPLSKR